MSISPQDSTHRACVFTPGAVHYGNGTMTPLRPGVHRDLRAILNGTPGRFAKHSTIVIDGVRPDDLDASGLDPWQFSKLGAWTLYHRADGRTVAVGLRDEMNPRHFGVLVEPDTDPGVLAVLLDRYNRATGMSWRGTCATTALNAIRLTWENVQYEPRWNHQRVGPGYAAGPIVWSRPLTADEREWGLVHTFDAQAAYLGAAGNADLAWSVLEHSPLRPFDRTAPGYWKVRLAPSTLALMDDPLRPPLLPAAGRVVDGTAWLTTPYAEFLHELGDPIDVIDAWTAHDGRRPAGFRVLRKWQEQLRDARLAVDAMPPGGLHDTIAYAVKRTYKDATGGMQRQGMRVFRPDWAHTLIDLWRATLYRRIIHVRESQGVWPVAVKTDSVSYADMSHPQPRGFLAPMCETLTDALNVATCDVTYCRCTPPGVGRLGTMRHESTWPVEVWDKLTNRGPK